MLNVKSYPILILSWNIFNNLLILRKYFAWKVGAPNICTGQPPPLPPLIRGKYTQSPEIYASSVYYIQIANIKWFTGIIFYFIITVILCVCVESEK